MTADGHMARCTTLDHRDVEPGIDIRSTVAAAGLTLIDSCLPAAQ